VSVDLAQSVVPSVTLVIGAVLGFGADALRDRRLVGRNRQAQVHEREQQAAAAQLERERDEAVAVRARDRERDQFQRETLIELQDWFAKCARCTSKMHVHDEHVFRDTGRWARDPVEEDLSNAESEARANVLRLVVRVENDQVRAAVGEVLNLMQAATQGAAYGQEDAPVRDAAVQAFGQMSTRYGDVHILIGEQMRTLA
jgi:hypothetical protein